MAERIEQHLGTGRRKEAVARVYLRPGKGNMVVNGKEWRAYFGARPDLEARLFAALRTADVLGKYDVIANVAGGGPMGQAEAIRHGISRALVASDAATRPLLKKAGFLTRDARVVERKKPGLHKARKASQFSKR
jgi:small subunit ribosomal protein S9